jgi:hypothetical protein
VSHLVSIAGVDMDHRCGQEACLLQVPPHRVEHLNQLQGERGKGKTARIRAKVSKVLSSMSDWSGLLWAWFLNLGL